MNCKIESEFNQAIELGKAINETHPGQTADTTVSFLDTTSKNIVKKDGKYGAVGNFAARIKESVTEKAARLKPYRGKTSKLLEQQAEIGQYAHAVIEELTGQLLTEVEGKSTDAAYTHIKNATSFSAEGLKKINEEFGRTMSSPALQNVFLGVKENLISIYRQQKAINKITGKDGKVSIRMEQIVIDPRTGLGGTLDFLAIFSDNTAAIVDYKTKILKAYNKDAHGNIVSQSKLVTKNDLEKYKLQTGEYGRILRESYGVKSIASITVLPITLDLKLDTNLGKYSLKIDKLKFPGQDPLLEKVLPFSNATRFKSLDEFIRQLDDKIARLQARIRTSPDQKDVLQDRINALENGKKEILINHNLNSILDYGKSLASKVTKAELGGLSISELQDLKDELQLLASISESTYEYREFLKNTNKQAELEDLKLKIGEVVTEIKDKIEIVKEILFEDKITKLIELHTGYKILDDFGNYIPFTQEGYFGKWFYQLSQYDNPVFKTLRSILDDINYNVRLKTDKVVEDIIAKENKVYSWLKSTGRSFEDFVKIMINPATDNFWGKYSPEYFDMLKLANGSTLYQYYTPSEKYEETYMTRLINTTNRLKQQGLTGTALQKAVDEWISKNDLGLNDQGKPLHPEAWENNRNWLTMKDNPSEYNEHYQFILSVPELKDYYQMFEHYNKEFRKILDVDYFSLPNNFLPNVRKTMSERISEQGFNGFISGTKDFLKDFSVREEDQSLDMTYNSRSQIPIFFMNPFKSADGELEIGEKSYQFGRSLAIFAKMAYNYQATFAREGEILGLQEFLSTEAEQHLQNRGKNLIDQMGNQISEKLQATDLPDIFRSFVDMYVYKIGVKPVIGDKSGKIEKQLLKAKEYFTLKVLGFNVVAGLGSLASAKINSMVEANKGIIYSKKNYQDAMNASWFDREKFLALNAFFDPMGHRLNNPVIGGEKNFGERHYGDPTMRGFINKYVNSRMLMNTFSIGDEYIEEMITAAMAKHYYVDNLGNLRRVKSDVDMETYKDRLIWNLFDYSKESGAKLNLSEEQIQKVFIDFRRAIQAGQSRIKGTIPEEDKAHWQSNIVGQLVMHFKSWMPGILFERFGKVKFDDRIDSMYMGKYTALGKEFQNPDKLVFKEFFKKIFLPKIGKLVADLATFGMLSKSRLNDVHNKQLAFERWLDLNPHHKGKVTFEDFNEVQQKQLKSVIQELRVLLVLAGLIVLMGMDWDDDGEKDYNKYLLTRKLASLLFKTQQELSFVYSPVSFASMVKSPIPMIGLVNDAWKTIGNTIDEILDIPFGEERLIGGQDKDNKPILSESIKWIPGFGGVIRFLDVLSTDVQYETVQN